MTDKFLDCNLLFSELTDSEQQRWCPCQRISDSPGILTLQEPTKAIKEVSLIIRFAKRDRMQNLRVYKMQI